MAFDHSFNKPNLQIRKASHASCLARKRAARAKMILPQGKYTPLAVRRSTDTQALAVLSGSTGASGPKLTRTVLSGKKARKIERTLRYAAQRKQQKLNAETAAEDGMDVDAEDIAKRQKKVKPETKLDKVKKALWTALENASSETLQATGEGTTLGIQAF
ncbi:ribosomal pre-60S maturation factor [Metschnikowia bicuspidata]|uniref:Ribosomal pre-60S maturation factor n=1 Tax=Metschnikowia bicuspidata TaxID=27322 RepID=A0A4V1J3J8_9ASCO|nr:ribosomal pre-60S maturation factor [Metschnikowia bicuspidata]